MRPKLLSVILASGGLFVLGCADDRGPLPTSPPSLGHQSMQFSDIEAQINALFPERGLRNAAFKILRNFDRQLHRGRTTAAQDIAASKFAVHAVEQLQVGHLIDQPYPANVFSSTTLATKEAVRQMLVAAFLYVSLPTGGAQIAVDVEVEDFGVGVAHPDQDSRIVTNTGFALAEIPAGAVGGEVLVIIQRVVLAEGEDCLPSARTQREGCYEFQTQPELAGGFNTDVIMGVCADVSGLTEAQEERFRLYVDEGGPSVIATPNVFVDINCETFAAAGSNGLLNFARRGWRAVQRHLAPWFSPPPLAAINRGFGGKHDTFTGASPVIGGYAGSSVLVYGPSLTPLTSFRTDNEETLAADEGHFVTVVDGATWAGLNATGPGGFGDYDGLVFGDGFGSLADAESNAATWGGVVTGRVVVSAIHAGLHQCDLILADCLSRNAEQFHNPEARTFIRQAINWAAVGTTTGAYVALDNRFSGAGDPPGVPVDFLDGIGDFDVVGFDPNVTFLSKEDSVVVTDPGHPVVAGLDGDDFSGWFLSYHQLFNSVPAAFSTVAEGFRRVDPSNPSNPLVAFPVIVAR